MSFDFSTLITDRSQADAEALRALLSTALTDWTAEQLTAFNQAASRGAYNYTDLNRVTACMDNLNERLTALGYQTGYQRIVVPHREMPSSRLPEGYQEVEYIQSSGTQYIDTGFKPNQDTRVSLEFKAAIAPSNDWILGSRKSTNVDSYGIMAGSSTSVTSWFGTASVSKTVTSLTNIFNLDKDKGQTTIKYADGELVTISNAPSDFESEYNLFLMNINLAGSPASAAIAGRLYSCQIYDDGTMIRDFIPCQDPTGVVGLYDLVGAQFYGNAGSGNFLPGPEVSKPEPVPDPEPMDLYTWYEIDAPTVSSMAAYLANVSALRGVLTLPDNTAAVPADMDGLTVDEANAIEEILLILYNYLTALQKIFLRSGMAWAVSGGPGFYFKN